MKIRTINTFTQSFRDNDGKKIDISKYELRFVEGHGMHPRGIKDGYLVFIKVFKDKTASNLVKGDIVMISEDHDDERLVEIYSVDEAAGMVQTFRYDEFGKPQKLPLYPIDKLMGKVEYNFNYDR